jgi:hypothetical protein
VDNNQELPEDPKGRGMTVNLSAEQAAQLNHMCEGTFRSGAAMIRYLIHQEYCINYEPYGGPMRDMLAPSTVGAVNGSTDLPWV